MTTDTISIILIAAVAAALLAYLIFGRRQRVRIDADRPVLPTLSRDRTGVAAPSAPVSAVPDGGDDLRLIKGLGPKIAARLGELGITRFDQIAALDADAIAALDAQLGSFAGRITRDNWVEQAGLLARDDRAAFEARYGKIGSGAP